MQDHSVLRLGTRGSPLARAQCRIVADQLRCRCPHLRIDVCVIRTTGDRIADRPLHEFGGKGLFTRELEHALLDARIDVAVHSFKDVPVATPLVQQQELVIAAVPLREDPRDALVSFRHCRLEDLSSGAVVGTGSPRRRAQLLSWRSDLRVEPLRGNIDTRLRRLRHGDFDAVILAMAGLKRAGLLDESCMHPIPVELLLPAAGQGALALQCRRGDRHTQSLLQALNDPCSARCVQLEREVVRRLEGDCHSPIAVLATIDTSGAMLQVAVGRRDGLPPVLRAAARTEPERAEMLVDQVMAVLSDQGVARLLRPE